MHFQSILNMFSSVSGGPLERMTESMKRREQKAKLCAALKPEQWRFLFRKGKIGRLTARALTFGLYPIQTLVDACLLSLKAKPLEKSILVVSTNPFFLPHFLVATKALHRCGVVSLMYDMYPDALEAAGIENKWLSRCMTIANHWMLKHSDGVVYIGDVMRASSEERYGKNPHTIVIQNGANKNEFKHIKNALPNELREWMCDRCIFSYVGNMGLMHDVETLEKAIPLFIQDLPDEEKACIGFIFAATGPGEARLRESLKDYSDYVRFIGPQNDDAWAELLSRTDIALATLTNQAHATSAPSKIYSAISAKCIPLVVAPENSDLAHLVHQCGYVVHPGDVSDMLNTLKAVSEIVIADDVQYAQNLDKVEAVANETDIENISDLWQKIFNEIVDDLPSPWSTTLYHAIKRAFDLAASGIGLAAIWPILAVTAVEVKRHLGSPILFKQQRPGVDCKPFELLKFRSMSNAPAGTDATHDGERLSDFGKKIRALSLDELPTLLNVLKGDMSLVGPRPLLMSYLERYDDEQIKRQWAKPGVTGWAQVNGRNALSWEEKFAHDVWYVQNASPLLDLKILLMTAMTVLKRSGIQHAGSATMPEFMGNKE